MITLSIERVCAYCKSKEPSEKYVDRNKPTEKMEIAVNNIEDYVYYNKFTYHKECFEIVLSKKKKKLSNDDVLAVLVKSKAHIKQALVLNEIFHFMLENYNLTVISNDVFQKLQSIYSGTFRGMSKGIPVADLLDMWQRKIKYLNKVHNQNITKGKTIEGNSRILYDLSVLINKYDSYLQWKREQQILQATSTFEEERNDNQKINFNIIEKQVKNQRNNSSSDDLNSLLEEMF